MVDGYFGRDGMPGEGGLAALEASPLRRGNFMARMRMSVLYDRSVTWRGLVVGTGNKTESLIGYTTLFGDSACAFNPVGDLYKSQVRQLSAAIGVPERELKMRIAQVWHWIYFRGARDFSEMTNVGKGLRAALAEAYTLARPEVVNEQVSKDGTRKWLIRMPSTGPFDKGAEIECVYIPEVDRGTLCVSSQVGCTLTCSFCHTGTQRLVRNLTSAEIVAQLIVARDSIGDWPDATPPEGGMRAEVIQAADARRLE